MNHGVLFEINGIEKHSFDDWGLLLKPLTIDFPEVKTKYIEIEGGNGSLDLTEAYGKVFYKDRKFNIEFTCNDKLRYDETLREITSFLHGREVKVTFYFDEEYYYIGRISFNKYTSRKGVGTMVFNAVFRPYKLKQDVTITTNTVVDKKVVTYLNDRLEVTPRFKADSNMTFEFKGNSYALGTTETVFPSIEFTEGENVIVWHGNGVVSVIYQEGSL